MLFPQTLPPATRIQAAFQAHYPAACACLRKQGITYQFQPGPAGFPNHSTLVLWREVPGYRYKLGVRPSGELLSPTGHVLSPVELETLVAELGTRWQPKAQQPHTSFQGVGWLMAMQVCVVLGVVALAFVGLSWWEEGAANAREIVELLGATLFFGVAGIICHAHRRKACAPVAA